MAFLFVVDRQSGGFSGRPVYGLPRLAGQKLGMIPAPVSPPTGEFPKAAKHQRGVTPFGVAVLVVVFIVETNAIALSALK
ncbi:MAG: hypothetical protein ACRCWO_09055 [Bosea sp. (in: a-proteobacteria)]